MSDQPALPRELTLSQLGSHLWEAANILRGSPVDRTDWKSYILPLLFFKRICDVWDEEHAEAVQTYGEDFEDEHRFQVPDGCHWRDLRRTSSNVGKKLRNAMRGIEAANQQHLYGVFGDAQWTNKDRLPDELLKDLIEHFSALPLGNEAARNNVIGDAYEYLIKKFADATNKNDSTPVMVERIVGDIDEIVRLVRFPGWQQTSAGEREVKKALRKTLFKYKLHADAELFDKAYGYIKQYY